MFFSTIDLDNDSLLNSLPKNTQVYEDIILKIHQFFKPYILKFIDDEELDCHFLSICLLLSLCNQMLFLTGNEKKTRKLIPYVKQTSIYSLQINVDNLYTLLAPAISNFVAFDKEGYSITNLSMTRLHKENLFGSFFDIALLNSLCNKNGYNFDYKIILNNNNNVCIQVKKEVPSIKFGNKKRNHSDIEKKEMSEEEYEITQNELTNRRNELKKQNKNETAK